MGPGPDRDWPMLKRACMASEIALVAGVLAIREGLDLDSSQAIIVTLVGWLALVIVAVLIGSVLGVGAAFGGMLAGN